MMPRLLIRRLMLTLAILCASAGCQSAPPPSGPAAHQTIVSAELLRWLNYAGLTRNDQLTVTSPDEIAALRGYFPDLGTKDESTVKGTWTPWIIIHFHRADGSETYISSDYRIYRIDDGQSGDFVARPGFADHIEQLFANSPPQ
jgi:hypothetical protein